MTRPLFSCVIPTIGRASLPQTLASINRDYAEAIVVADAFEADPDRLRWIEATAKEFGARYFEEDAGYHDWGSPQLQRGYAEAQGEWILNEGDDDVFEPFAFETIKRAIESIAEPVPMMFRTALHPSPVRGNTNIAVLWQYPTLTDKNITGQCIVIPNDQARIGSWSILVDFGFITDTVRLWDGRVEWRTEIISQCF